MNVRPHIKRILLFLLSVVNVMMLQSARLSAQAERQVVLMKNGREYFGIVQIDSAHFFVMRTTGGEVTRLPVHESTLIKGQSGAPDTIVYEGSRFIGTTGPTVAGFIQVRTESGELITAALDRHKGNRRLVARELKISERTLYRKIKDYGLQETNC